MLDMTPSQIRALAQQLQPSNATTVEQPVDAAPAFAAKAPILDSIAIALGACIPKIISAATRATNRAVELVDLTHDSYIIHKHLQK